MAAYAPTGRFYLERRLAGRAPQDSRAAGFQVHERRRAPQKPETRSDPFPILKGIAGGSSGLCACFGVEFRRAAVLSRKRIWRAESDRVGRKPGRPGQSSVRDSVRAARGFFERAKGGTRYWSPA